MRATPPVLFALDGTAIAVSVIGAAGLIIVAFIGLWNGRSVRSSNRGVERIERQFVPNGGKSAFDQLAHRFDRLELLFDRHADEIADVKAAIGDMAGVVMDLMAEAKTTKQWQQEHEIEVAEADRRHRERGI